MSAPTETDFTSAVAVEIGSLTLKVLQAQASLKQAHATIDKQMKALEELQKEVSDLKKGTKPEIVPDQKVETKKAEK